MVGARGFEPPTIRSRTARRDIPGTLGITKDAENRSSLGQATPGSTSTSGRSCSAVSTTSITSEGPCDRRWLEEMAHRETVQGRLASCARSTEWTCREMRRSAKCLTTGLASRCRWACEAKDQWQPGQRMRFDPFASISIASRPNSSAARAGVSELAICRDSPRHKARNPWKSMLASYAQATNKVFPAEVLPRHSRTMRGKV